MHNSVRKFARQAPSKHGKFECQTPFLSQLSHLYSAKRTQCFRSTQAIYLHLFLTHAYFARTHTLALVFSSSIFVPSCNTRVSAQRSTKGGGKSVKSRVKFFFSRGFAGLPLVKSRQRPRDRTRGRLPRHFRRRRRLTLSLSVCKNARFTVSFQFKVPSAFSKKGFYLLSNYLWLL